MELPYKAADPSARPLIYSTIEFRQWATSVMNLLKGVFGENSPHYKIFYKAMTGIQTGAITST